LSVHNEFLKDQIEVFEGTVRKRQLQVHKNTESHYNLSEIEGQGTENIMQLNCSAVEDCPLRHANTSLLRFFLLYCCLCFRSSVAVVRASIRFNDCFNDESRSIDLWKSLRACTVS
jgi:hypothetical protein